jgi:hypothetical protein
MKKSRHPPPLGMAASFCVERHGRVGCLHHRREQSAGADKDPVAKGVKPVHTGEYRAAAAEAD